ncbi:MAG: ACP S-malonyltransferase [Bacteroidetes bacterium]|uniref:Malonyl CoA-acyl carrier protein transacylase n=1 Tax=Candidatus Cryptobacteroides avistercoris TaxID=2840758 RepID=A0A9D9NP38_9BACT|nr:ACP S-malonyltransferase [Candidatus Cryptobacteroides avistercoris]
MKTAHVFPGQGAQFSGMGRDLYENSEKARSLMDKANEILGFRITDIMFEGSDEDLRATKVTQPAVFIHSVCAALAAEGVPAADMVGGHSLGEFSALVACGAVAFEDALRLVAVRAEEMQKCCEVTPGGMAAIIGLPDSKVEEVCASVDGLVIPANYNSDGQVVISGEKAAVEKACELLKAAGAKRALPLSVGGAFHSPLMEPARVRLAEAIEKTEVKAPVCPIYQNVNALPETDPVKIKENLLKQLTSPVRWTQTVKNMIADGAVNFKEFGPGAVLQGLIKRIAPSTGVEVTIL